MDFPSHSLPRGPRVRWRVNRYGVDSRHHTGRPQDRNCTVDARQTAAGHVTPRGRRTAGWDRSGAVEEAVGHNRALVEHDHPVGVSLHRPQVMGDQNDARALVANVGQRLEQACLNGAVQSGRRLVGHQEGGAQTQSDGDLYPAGHSSREHVGVQLEKLFGLLEPHRAQLAGTVFRGGGLSDMA